MKRTSSEPAYSANNRKSAARRKAKKRRARNRLILKVSAVMLLLCTLFVVIMKYVDYNNSQTNAASDNKKNGRSSTSVTLTQSANYPEAYKDEIMKTIRTVENDETNDSISYIFITDMHIDTSEETREVAYNQLYAIVDIANNSDIDFVCVGGDMYNGRYADPNGKVIAMDTIESISKILELCNKPVFILKGNHDDNSFSAQINEDLLFDADHIINREEWYSITMKHFSQYATDYQNGYYYYDIPGKNTRVVCLNMSDSDDTVTDGKQNQMGMYFYGYQNEQINWLLNDAMSRDNCNYIFLCHDAFDYPEGYSTESNRDTLRAIMAAAYTHTPFAANSFAKDFTSWSGNVLLYHSGHLHMERAVFDSETGGLPLLNTQTSMFSVQSRGWMQDKGYYMDSGRQKGTATEALFDVVVARKDDINIVRFGVGDDYSLKKK